MTPQQARLLVAALRRLADKAQGAHEQINDFAAAIGVPGEPASVRVTAGAADVGRPQLTIHENRGTNK